MKKNLHLKNKIKNNRSVILYKFKIKAFVIDQFSEKKSHTETEIAIHTQPYKIIIKAPDAFIPDEILIFKIKVSITDLQDNPIEDTQHPIKIFVQCISSSRVDQNPLSLEYVYKIEKDDYALINITNHNFTACYLHAEYRGIKSSESRIKKNYNSLFLEVLTESPEVSKELKIKLKSLEPIENFAYEIVSRGDIIKSELIEMPKNQTSYILSLNVTFLMVPKITIYVHGIKKRNFIGQLKDIYIKRTFKNSIQITTDEETKPDSLVNINVTTDKGSYVGLMALDYRILQNLHKSDDLTEDYFYTKLRDYDSLSFAQSYSGAKAGLVTFTNAQKDTRIFSGWGWDDEAPITGDSGTGFFQLPAQFEKPFLEFPYIRKLFSESWLYKDFERTPLGGLNFMETTPDTITTWDITGFSLNPNTGLTLTKNPTYLKVFQEFFISMDLPSLIREGEIIEVSVYIRNHMNQEAWTNVTIESDKEGLEFLEHPEEKSKKIISRLIYSKKSEKITFFLRPLKQGQYNVICKAISLKASDAIQKTLNVQSQGIPYAMSKTLLVQLPEEGIQEDEITIDIPENAVPDSQRIEISVVGDVFRHLLRNLQKLASVPYGNGEDNMKYFVSNLLVLKYLKALNYSKPNLEGKLRLNLELGYQNQLSFKHLDGSFGLFERKTSERTGNVWQTAFALWGLKQASEFIHIDIRIIKRGLRYLKSKQLGNGCFESRNGIEEDVKVTAFGLMVFLMDDHSKTGFSGVISRGLQCLSDQTNASINSPSFLMSTFALLLSNHEKAENCLRKLTNRSHLAEKKRMFWTKEDNFDGNLETIAGNLVKLFESQYNSSSNLQIIRELLNSESDRISSIIQLIALKELIGFVENLRSDRKKLEMTFNDDQKGTSNFQVNLENSQVLQTLKISRRSRKIHFQAKGYGFAVLQVKYKYNRVPENQYFSTFLSNVTTKMSSEALTVLEFCSEIFRNGNYSSLMVMEVNLQSGYVFTEENFQEVDYSLNKGIKSIQLDHNQDRFVVYFENEVCFKLKALREYNVVNAKPGWVIMYALEKKDSKTVKSFIIDDSYS